MQGETIGCWLDGDRCECEIVVKKSMDKIEGVWSSSNFL